MIDFLHPALKLTKTVHKTTHTIKQRRQIIVLWGCCCWWWLRSWTYRIYRYYDAAVWFDYCVHTAASNRWWWHHNVDVAQKEIISTIIIYIHTIKPFNYQYTALWSPSVMEQYYSVSDNKCVHNNYSWSRLLLLEVNSMLPASVHLLIACSKKIQFRM